MGPLIDKEAVKNYLETLSEIENQGGKWLIKGGLAGREQLENLIFVVNCNLQRLDGPVRGNGKIIQELEGAFRGEGWNVIKVVWGRFWDPIIEKDTYRRRIQTN